MAYINTTNFANDGKIGVDFTKTYASCSAGSTSFPPCMPGDRIRGSNASDWMFVRAESEISAYNLCGIAVYADSASTTPVPRAAPVTTTTIAPGGVAGVAPILGIAQTNIPSSYYGWIALEGSLLQVTAAASSNPKLPLFTTSTAGVVSSSTVSAGYIQGLTLLTSAASASAPNCMARAMGIITSNPV